MIPLEGSARSARRGGRAQVSIAAPPCCVTHATSNPSTHAASNAYAATCGRTGMQALVAVAGAGRGGNLQHLHARRVAPQNGAPQLACSRHTADAPGLLRPFDGTPKCRRGAGRTWQGRRCPLMHCMACLGPRKPISAPSPRGRGGAHLTRTCSGGGAPSGGGWTPLSSPPGSLQQAAGEAELKLGMLKHLLLT